MAGLKDSFDNASSRFAKLSRSRQDALRREAKRYIRDYPHMRDASIFWRGCSAQHVMSMYSSARRAELERAIVPKRHTCVTDNQGLCHYCGTVMNPDWHYHYING